MTKKTMPPNEKKRVDKEINPLYEDLSEFEILLLTELARERADELLPRKSPSDIKETY